MQIFDLKCAFILGILFANSLCEERPKIIQEVSGTIERNSGENATFYCKVDNPKGYTVSWVKLNRDNPSDQTVLTYDENLVLKDRLNVSVTPARDTYTLEITNIEFSDAAVYQCQVTVSTTYKDFKSVDLLIRYPPKIDRAVEVTPKVATLGGTAELKCIADGYPKPSISWTRATGGFLPAGGHYYNGTVLKINEVSVQDRGIYYCHAHNIMGQAKRTVNFEVEFAPKISVPRPRVAQALRYDTELECKVESFPAAQISWYKDGVEIHNENDYSITMTGTIDDTTYSVLHITTVESYQYGTYVCKALNRLGSDEKKVDLFAHPIPNIYFSGLQWTSSSSKPFIHMRCVMNSIAMILLASFMI